MKGFDPKKLERLSDIKYQICRILLSVRLGRLDANAVMVFTTEKKNRAILTRALKEIEADGLTDGVEYFLSQDDDAIFVWFDFSNPDKKSPSAYPVIKTPEEFKESFPDA